MRRSELRQETDNWILWRVLDFRFGAGHGIVGAPISIVGVLLFGLIFIGVQLALDEGY